MAAPVPAIAWGPVGVVLGVVAALLVVTSTRYGYHRDELYYLAAGRHLAWGYSDQGPLSPFLAEIFGTLGHGSLLVFRIPSMLAALGSGLLASLIARELDGRIFAQVLTAMVAGGGLFVLAAGHLLVTSTFDLLVWVAVSYLVLRLLRTGEDRWWLVIGLVAGIGLLNKTLPVVLLLGIAVGLVLVSPARSQLRSPWLWAGGLAALAIWSPYLIWQATNGWPQLTISGEIRAEYSVAEERIGFAVLQLVLFGIAAMVLWIVGLISLLQERARRSYRVLVWIWLVTLVVFVVTAGQGYYTAGTYPALIAAGAVAFERWTHRRTLLIVAVVVTTLVMLPPFIPVVPVRILVANPMWSGLAENQLETVGWPEFVDQVAAVYATVPATGRNSVTILTDNYGEAGAVDRYGPALGLPPPTAVTTRSVSGDRRRPRRPRWWPCRRTARRRCSSGATSSPGCTTGTESTTRRPRGQRSTSAARRHWAGPRPGRGSSTSTADPSICAGSADPRSSLHRSRPRGADHRLTVALPNLGDVAGDLVAGADAAQKRFLGFDKGRACHGPTTAALFITRPQETQALRDTWL